MGLESTINPGPVLTIVVINESIYYYKNLFILNFKILRLQASFINLEHKILQSLSQDLIAILSYYNLFKKKARKTFTSIVSKLQYPSQVKSVSYKNLNLIV